MSLLKIITYGNPVLQKKADPVKDINAELVEFAKKMVSTMHSAPGIGLAAPQVNMSKRLITIDLSVGENKEDLIVLVNPELLVAEGENVSEEGCLSIPGIQEKVSRPARVVVKGIDLEGREKYLEAEGLLARVLCHEIDHINGKLLLDHLSPLKRSLLRKKLKKQIQQTK